MQPDICDGSFALINLNDSPQSTAFFLLHPSQISTSMLTQKAQGAVHHIWCNGNSAFCLNIVDPQILHC